MSTYEDFGQELNFNHLKSLFLNLRPNNINQRRWSLQTALNGEAFYPIHTWPLKIQLMFTSTPYLTPRPSVQERMPPLLCIEYLCTSYFYAPRKALKRLYQIKWICANFTNKHHIWYYYDMETEIYKYLKDAEIPHNTPWP